VVVLKVARGSPAARLRLLPGDRISAVADQPIGEIGELARVLRTARPPWRLEIEREGRQLAVVIG
jgi:S1-C subfamily serine protease